MLARIFLNSRQSARRFSHAFLRKEYLSESRRLFDSLHPTNNYIDGDGDGRFFIALFSALEQTHCVFVACDIIIDRVYIARVTGSLRFTCF